VRNVKLRGVRIGVESSARDALNLVVREVEERNVGTILESTGFNTFNSVVGEIDAHQVQVLEGELLNFCHLIFGNIDQLEENIDSCDITYQRKKHIKQEGTITQSKNEVPRRTATGGTSGSRFS
jgi:hypothetical protein